MFENLAEERQQELNVVEFDEIEHLRDHRREMGEQHEKYEELERDYRELAPMNNRYIAELEQAV
ncbi:hypothetical protein JKG47_23365, partial [Acidithiobacillus sp. MC6.1]|nr:hypothetical protein [Acidithiobacillus sp. MC6.1]